MGVHWFPGAWIKGSSSPKHNQRSFDRTSHLPKCFDIQAILASRATLFAALSMFLLSFRPTEVPSTNSLAKEITEVYRLLLLNEAYSGGRRRLKMRPLTEDEIKLVLEKLSKFLGDNLMHMIENPSDPHLFRLHRDRVFFLSEKLLKAAGCIPRKNLLSAGQCIGKITKGRKFRLGITALHLIARYAPHKVWLNPGGEQAFVYGNHIIKRHVGRLTADMPSGAGVCVLSLNGDLPLGFGTSAKSTAEIHTAPTEAISFYHHADVGEYLREEADLV